MKNLLVELFVEELPPKALKKMGESFAAVLADSLRVQRLLTTDSVVTPYASPRRLAMSITSVLRKAEDKPTIEKIMPAKAGFSGLGIPTAALRKKLGKILWSDSDSEAVDIALNQTYVEGDQIFFRTTLLGMALEQALQQALEKAINELPIPKVMTYQLADGWSSVQFVRPAHKLIALHGADVVPVSVLGLQAGRTTQGHRFEAKNATLEIRDADSYETQMENEGAVIPSFEKRRAEIVRQLAEVAAKVGGGVKPIEDDALLDEVTALVERPNVLLCQFDAQFLEVPQECLILTMKANQKYFPLLDGKGKLTNKFLVVSNINPADASAVIGGNERVVRPRLADAKFFFDQDRKKTLESRVLGLAKVVYHNKLGTQGERVQRVCAIARDIGQQLGGEALAFKAEQAALLSKADLLTDMVGEFPELQGIMGRYYAKHDGLSDDIAFAIQDHYKPRFAGDELPRNQVGICVALADKLETLVGMFGIGEKPTGDKDPFALRRHALGVIRMLIENELPLGLDKLIEQTVPTFLDISIYAELHKRIDAEEIARKQRQNPGSVIAHSRAWTQPSMPTESLVDVMNFIYERLAGSLRDQGYGAQEVDAVLSLRPPLLKEVPKRLAAVRAFAALPEAAALAAANKRVGNILKKAEGDTALRQAQGERIEVNVHLLQEPAEQALHLALSQIAPQADAAFAAGDYTASLQALAALKGPVDAFFDNVMVNVEDAALRANRLALLAQLQQAMNRVADISRLAA
ncbi:MAG: glycine--tRNA ligase subunit beta [Gallionellaceae bacterium]